MIKKIIICFSFFLFGFFAIGQNESPFLQKGDFSLGVRTTSSLFGKDGVPGLGTGGQFRLQLFDFLSTEWFADWITTDLKGAGTRQNAHVGWSVLFYPKKMGRFSPYLMAGHCFDYRDVTPLSTAFVDRSADRMSSWSSAVQMGFGTHLFLTNRFNMTLSGQYMLHLGEHLDYELQAIDNGYFLNTNEAGEHEAGLEGHLLLTLSVNYRIADLW